MSNTNSVETTYSDEKYKWNKRMKSISETNLIELCKVCENMAKLLVYQDTPRRPYYTP